MRRILVLGLTVVGAGLLVLGLIALFPSNSTYAQDSSNADYIGARECGQCHRDLARAHQDTRHALALQNVEREKDAILADFAQGEDVRTVQIPGEDAARPFTIDDIAFAVGSGRYVQRYLYEVDRNEYAVLPAEWNTVENVWQPYRPAENWPEPAYDWTANCAGCHTTGLNVERGRWEDEGIQCEACHGPGGDHAEEASGAGRNPNDRELRRLRETIVVSPDAQICGQCHSAGVAPETELPYPVGYRPAQNLLDEAVFRLSPPDDSAHWWPTGHANHKNMQFNEWYNSAHASALTTLRASDQAEDRCLQCHSSDYRWTETLLAQHVAGEREGDAPAPINVRTAQFGVTCVTCHEPHQETITEYQLPAEPYSLCVQCHSDASTDWVHHPVQQMYEGQPIVNNVRAVASTHFTDEQGPDCVTCHMARVPVMSGTRGSHALYPVVPGAVIDVVGLPDTCSQCHSEQVTQAQMQQLIDDVQNDTSARLEAAKAAVQDITPDWVNIALAFVDGDSSLGIHNYAYTDALLDAVEAELGLDQSDGN